MILRVDLVMCGSLVIVVNHGRVLDHRREGSRRVSQRELVVRVERNLLLMGDGGHLLRVRPQIHRLAAFRHQIHDRG